MASRMDKYYNDSEFNPVAAGGRVSKNSQLYKDLYNNRTYTKFTNIENNAINLSNIDTTNNNNRRSTSNKARNFYENNVSKSSQKIDNVTYLKILEDDTKDKIYNVNDVMEMAKKNRTLEDEEEKKRRLKSVEYSILSDLSQEKLKEYRDKKEKGISKDEEENLEELIHTITSKSLRKKIDDELLKDLLPLDEDETIISKEMLDELEKEDNKEIIIDDNLDIKNEDEDTKDIEDDDKDTANKLDTTSELEKTIDKSFYTRSMDLKKEDLIFENDDNELDESFIDEKGSSIGKIIGIALLVLFVVGVVIYILHRFVQ